MLASQSLHPTALARYVSHISLENLANVCSHLQNCSRVRLSTTSILLSKTHLRLCLALQREGFISTVNVGGIYPPKSEEFSQSSRDGLAEQLAIQPWMAYPMLDSRQDPDRSEHILPRNPAERRIWIGLKYWKNQPVLTKMHLVSKPSRPIEVTLPQLQRFTRGFRAGYIDGLKNPGECLYLATELGVLEARECLQRLIGGLALCRVS